MEIGMEMIRDRRSRVRGQGVSTHSASNQGLVHLLHMKSELQVGQGTLLRNDQVERRNWAGCEGV